MNADRIAASMLGLWAEQKQAVRARMPRRQSSVDVHTDYGWFTARRLTEEGLVAVEFPGSAKVFYFTEEEATAIRDALQEVMA